MSSHSSIPAYSPPPYSSPSSSPHCDEGKEGDESLSVRAGVEDKSERLEALDRWMEHHPPFRWASYPIESSAHLNKILRKKKIRLRQKEHDLRKGKLVKVSFNGRDPVHIRIPKLESSHIRMLDQWMAICSNENMNYGWKFEIDDELKIFKENFQGEELLLDTLNAIQNDLNVLPFSIMLAYDEKNIQEGIDRFLGQMLRKHKWIPIYKLNYIRDKYLRINGTNLESQQSIPFFMCRKLEHINEKTGKPFKGYVITASNKFEIEEEDEECTFPPYSSDEKFTFLSLRHDVIFLYRKEVQYQFINYKNSYCIEDMSFEQKNYFRFSYKGIMSS